MKFPAFILLAGLSAATGAAAQNPVATVPPLTYERYALEFIRLTKRLGAITFEFEPYESAPAMVTTSRRRPLLAAT